MEVDLEDMRSANRILAVIRRGWALQLNLPIAKSPLRYLVDSQTLIFASEMRNVILDRNKTTWSNKDATLSPKEFYEPDINRRIAIREIGG